MTKLTTTQQRDLNTISNRNYTNALRASMTGEFTKRYMQSTKSEYPTIKSLVKKGLVVIKEHDYLYLTPAGIELTMEEYDFDQESQKVQQGIWKAEAYTKFLSIKESAFRNAIQTRLNNNPLPDGLEYEVRFDLHGNRGQDNVISTITVNNTNEWVSKHGGYHTVMIIDICSEGTSVVKEHLNYITYPIASIAIT
jgi:hypothetical protein